MKPVNVEAIFQDYHDALVTSDALPEIVLENRRQRAIRRVQDALASRGSDKISAQLKKELHQLIRRWTHQSFADGFKEIEDFEIRCAREAALVTARAAGDEAALFEALSADYQRRVVELYGRIELRGIQTSERVYFELDKVFIPLYLSKPEPKLDDDAQQISSELDTIESMTRRLVRVPTVEILRQHPHVLISGSPGSGKTTLVAYLAVQAAQSKLFCSEDGRERLPFVLTVRSFTTGSITPKTIASLSDCDIKLVQGALKIDRAILFVDGIDEAPERLAKQILKSLTRFRKSYPKTPIVVTSRPVGVRGEVLPGFARVELLALTHDEVETFIDKWCLAAELSVGKSTFTAESDGQEAAGDLKQRLAQSHHIQRLVETPLLATILCVVHRFLGHRIPEHRVSLYEKCTDVLLYEWDRSKLGHTALVGELDARAKRALLSGLAYRMHTQEQAEIPEVEVIDQFEQALPDLGKPADEARQIVAEIRDRSGILIERRPGYFAFSHLVFQEYLTALCFSPEHYPELIAHHSDLWWHEVITLAAGTEGADAGRLANSLLEEDSPSATFLAAQCLDTAIRMPLDIREKIEQRLAHLVPPKNEDDAFKLGRLGVIAAPALTKVLSSELDENELARTLNVLVITDYEPAVTAIGHLILSLGHPNQLSTHARKQIRAIASLAIKSESSALAKKNLSEIIPKLPHIIQIVTYVSLNKQAINSEFSEKTKLIYREILNAFPQSIKDEALRQENNLSKAVEDSD